MHATEKGYRRTPSRLPPLDGCSWYRRGILLQFGARITGNAIDSKPGGKGRQCSGALVYTAVVLHNTRTPRPIDRVAIFTVLDMTETRSEEQRLLLRLFDKSVLKKAKYAAICRYLPELDGRECLDIGADNGVISYLLRKRGGRWSSADLEPEVVDSIRRMVGERVCRFDGGRTGFADNTFDIVVIIDFLEHILEDRRFVAELARIMKDDGTLIVNVPHNKPNSPIRKLRLWLGLTDEKHGHVRPGYDAEELGRVLAPHYEVLKQHTYSGFFVELFDVAISLYFDRIKKGHVSGKGNVVTGDDLRKQSRQFKLFSVIYPVVKLLQFADRLLFFASGYSLIVKARRTG